jgi:hypothetical protein
VIDETFGVVGFGAGAGEVILLEPEVTDLGVVSEVEVVIDVAKEPDAGQGVGLIDLVANFGEVGAAFHKFTGDVVSGGPGGGVLEGAGVRGNGGEQTVGDGRRDGPFGGLQQAEDEFAGGGGVGGDPVLVGEASVAGMVIDVDEEPAFFDAGARGAEAVETGGIGGDDAIEDASGPGALDEVIGVEEGEFMGDGVLVPDDDILIFRLEGEAEAELGADAIAVWADVTDDAEGAALADGIEDSGDDLGLGLHQEFMGLVGQRRRGKPTEEPEVQRLMRFCRGARSVRVPR